MNEWRGYPSGVSPCSSHPWRSVDSDCNSVSICNVSSLTPATCNSCGTWANKLVNTKCITNKIWTMMSDLSNEALYMKYGSAALSNDLVATFDSFG